MRNGFPLTYFSDEKIIVGEHAVAAVLGDEIDQPRRKRAMDFEVGLEDGGGDEFGGALGLGGEGDEEGLEIIELLLAECPARRHGSRVLR